MINRLVKLFNFTIISIFDFILKKYAMKKLINQQIDFILEDISIDFILKKHAMKKLINQQIDQNTIFVNAKNTPKNTNLI